MTNSNSVTFYFMRHGETYFNFLGRIQGWSDAPLTAKGIHDVTRSAKGLADIQFDAIYSSDLKRAIDTANIVLKENHHSDNLILQTMPEFREVNFGSFEGRDVFPIWDEFIAEAHRKSGLPLGSEELVDATMNVIKEKDPYHFAENYVEFWQRVESGLLQLLMKHAGTGQKVLVVCHGLTIRNLLHGLVANFELGDKLENGSISIAKYIDGQFQLVAYNQTDHFEEVNHLVEEL